MKSCNPDFFPKFHFQVLRKHALRWATCLHDLGVALRNITLHDAPTAGVGVWQRRKYLVLLDIKKVVIPEEYRSGNLADVKQYLSNAPTYGVEGTNAKCCLMPEPGLPEMLYLRQFAHYFEGKYVDETSTLEKTPDGGLSARWIIPFVTAFNDLEDVYLTPPKDNWRDEWIFQFKGHPPDFPPTPERALPADCMRVLYDLEDFATSPKLHELDAQIEQSEPLLGASMYNLFVSADPEAWDGKPWLIEMSRCVREYTDTEITKRFGEFDATAVAELKRLPCIFAYEAQCKKESKVWCAKRHKKAST